MNTVLQILSAAAGSLGFGMLFRMRPSRLGWAALGGGLTWSIYLLGGGAGLGGFAANLIATVFAAAWAEVLAHVCRAPATIFTITAIVPLIPGGLLYRTMRALVDRDPSAAALGMETALTAGALAFGMMLVSVAIHILYTVSRQIQEKH